MAFNDRFSFLVASTTVFLLAFFLALGWPAQHECIPLLNSTGQQLASMFLPDNFTLNLEQMSQNAMNPGWLNNQSMTDLYSHATNLINGTNADSVLFQIDPILVNGTTSDESTMVLAVANQTTVSANQSEATHADLLQQFQMYFVNVQPEAPQDVVQAITANPLLVQAEKTIEETVQNIANHGQTNWRILGNFLKNQANAIIGAIMMPFNVGATAMQHSVKEHAEYVLAGSRYGARISSPVILTAVRFGNVVDQYVLNVTNDQADRIKQTEYQTKEMVGDTIDTAADTVSTGAQLLVQYAVRPVAAFTGFNMHLLGRTMHGLGTGIHRTGSTINLAGDGLRLGAQSAVSAGATAIAWAMDNSTSFLPPTPKPVITTPATSVAP